MRQRLTALDLAQVEPILRASQREGFRFVARLCEEWVSGVNRFEEPGEALFGVFVGSDLVGVGGLNRQSKATGRLRRFYILPAYRRQGWGRCLLRHILTHAADHFVCVVLRTDTESRTPDIGGLKMSAFSLRTPPEWRSADATGSLGRACWSD